MESPFDEAALRAFGALVVRLQFGGDLTREEARDAYLQVWRDQQPDLQQGALIAAHRCKQPTLDELVGLTESHNDEWTRCFPHVVEAPEPHLGIVGVGMDSLKTFNVSSATSVVIAACGGYVHKVGAPGMTGVSGAADAFGLWGVDGAGPLEKQVEAVAKCRLGFTTPVTPMLRHMGIGRVLSQLRIATWIHVAGPMGFHAGERRKIVGVPAPPLTGLVAQAMKTLGYERALVPCGGDAADPARHMDEFSNLGPTTVAELHADGRIEQYTLTPEDCGLATATYAQVVQADTREENARVGLRVLAGREAGPRQDLLAMNVAAGLKLLGKVDDWKQGVERARAAIEEGRALDQLRALIDHQNRDPAAGHAQLERMLGA